MVEPNSQYPYGSVARSGLEVRSVAKHQSMTLGVFATSNIHMFSFITSYGGIKTYKTELMTADDKSHALSLPNSLFVEDGKGLACLFSRPTVAGVVSLPCPRHTYSTTFLQSGVGFMMNHSPRRSANCMLRYIKPPPSLETMGCVAIPIFVSKRDIIAGEELTWCYNNFESFSFVNQ